jgi:hypothetical protein
MLPVKWFFAIQILRNFVEVLRPVRLRRGCDATSTKCGRRFGVEVVVTIIIDIVN